MTNGKGSRAKKRTRPGAAGAPSTGARAAGRGPSAPDAPAAPSGSAPLSIFQKPSVTPPSTTFRSPRPALPTRPAAKPSTATPSAAKPSAAQPAATPSAATPSTAPPSAPAEGDPTPGEVRRAPLLAADMPAGPVQVMSWNCAQLDGVEPHGLGLTYWFDAAPTGDPYPVKVRFTGRRRAGDGSAGGGEAFETVRTIDRVLPGSGRMALTARITGVAPGEWEVTATPEGVAAGPGDRAPAAPSGLAPAGSSTGTTAFLPVVKVRAPGVRIGAWPGLVALGFVLAMILQWTLGVQQDLPVGRILAVSVVGALVGLAGAKVYYLATHRSEQVGLLTAGMSVQGFVLAAISTLVLAGWAAGIPVGAMLDVSAPGLLVGMTVGRLGCFFGGCCVGLPTASRWGIWSSDRRVGVRRVPVQLFESAMAGTVATAVLLAVLFLDPAWDGLLFVAGLSAYTFGRQVLFPLRGIPRATSHGRLATMVVTGLVLVGSIVTLAVA